MTNMARVIDDVVTEVLKPIDGFDIVDCFHPDVLVGCVPCGDDVQPGWVLTENGFAAPNAPDAEEAAVEEEAPAEEEPAAE